MTSTITAPRHARRQAEPAPWAWDSVTAPIPVQSQLTVHPSAARPTTLRWIGSGVLAAALLLGTGAGAYALGHHDATSAPVPVAATATPAALPVATIVPTSTAVAPAGPQLVDTAGRPVDDVTAAQVRAVYMALQQNDVEALKRAEGAAGSDDGLTSFPHLTSAAVRNRLLDALRTHPDHKGTSYRFHTGSYALEFQQADGSLGAGLSSISGPWNTTTAPTTSPKTTSAPSSSVSPSGNGPTGRYGDGCGPYEHNLDGYCSPDVSVLDENGNPDPSKAVVPGNLKNPQHGD